MPELPFLCATGGTRQPWVAGKDVSVKDVRIFVDLFLLPQKIQAFQAWAASPRL